MFNQEIKSFIYYIHISYKKQEWKGHNYYKSKLFVNDDYKWYKQKVAYVDELAENSKDDDS